MEIIDRYSRADALGDGFLADVTTTAREAGFVYPVALTRAVWEDCVAWDDTDHERKGTLQDQAGRLWDVLWMASLAARRGGGTRTDFHLFRVPRNGRDTEARRVDLELVCGPGDDAEPVITIQQPGED